MKVITKRLAWGRPYAEIAQATTLGSSTRPSGRRRGISAAPRGPAGPRAQGSWQGWRWIEAIASAPTLREAASALPAWQCAPFASQSGRSSVMRSAMAFSLRASAALSKSASNCNRGKSGFQS